MNTDGRIQPTDRFRFDLGISRLLPEWRALLEPKGLLRDSIAGVTVACLAVPLSMAIAMASHAPVEAGLVTAIVAGVMCSLLGGTPLAVSGPAAAVAVLVATIVEDHGFSGLLLSGMLAGALQLTTGVLGLGRVMRVVPVPVVLGFTAGVGAIILIGQLPRVLGLPPPDQAHVIDVITHIRELIRDTHVPTLVLTLVTTAIMLVLPRFVPRVPAPLVAVIVCTAVALSLWPQVGRVGSIPDTLPWPTLPMLQRDDWGGIFANAAVLYALTSIETLLSSSAVDKLSRKHRHDPDQELVGQGLGNILAMSFGGIPATGVIARSTLNVLSGAQTRRAALIHALLVLATVYVLANVMATIPTAALTGVLLGLAVKMLDYRVALDLWRASASDVGIFAITFVAMVFFDLLAGVQAGIVAAFVIAGLRAGQSRVQLRTLAYGPIRLSIQGGLTVASLSQFDALRAPLVEANVNRGVIIDLSQVDHFDSTGIDALADLVKGLLSRGIRVVLLHASQELASALAHADRNGELGSTLAPDEVHAAHALGIAAGDFARERVLDGVIRFQQDTHGRYLGLFKQLATGQQPHTLFITCSDSRVSPTLMTSTEPGELFIHRNIGNIVPPRFADGRPAEGAGVEFAVGILGVDQIIVCGHSGCGAMTAILRDDVDPSLESVVAWLKDAQRLRQRLPIDASPDAAARANVLVQLENLRSYPVVESRLQAGHLQIHGWFYDIALGRIEEWNAEKAAFLPLGSDTSDAQGRRRTEVTQSPTTIH